MVRIQFDILAKFHGSLMIKGWFSREDHPELVLQELQVPTEGVRDFRFEITGQPESVQIPAAGFTLQILLHEDAFPEDLKMVFLFNEFSQTVDMDYLLAHGPEGGKSEVLAGRFMDLLPENARILDLGGRSRSGFSRRDGLPDMQVDILDIIDGPDVDIVADAHEMSRSLQPELYDGIMSYYVFEHLAMPWKVAVEMNRVLKPGGVAFIQTHQSVGLHDAPWDFFRFSDRAWKGIFNSGTGFEILGTVMDLPNFIIPFKYEDRQKDAERSAGYEISSVLVRKVGTAALDWPLAASDVTGDMYPETVDNRDPGWAYGLGTAGRATAEAADPAVAAKKLSVLVVTHNRGAVAQVRIISPLQELFRKDLIRYRIIAGEDGGMITHKDLEDVDIVVFQRLDKENMLQILHFAGDRGLRTVYEIDDNLLELPPSNPNFKHYNDPATRSVITEFIRNVDLVTVTTEALKDYLSPFNPNIAVLPNQIDEHIFNHVPAVWPRPRIRIGFAGTVTHQKDFQQVIPALKKIRNDFPDKVQLVFLNFVPDEFRDDPHIEFIPGIDNLPRFARIFDGAALDIGLAPLHFDEFNRGKSDVKFLEYAALNIAGIYSAFTPYENVVEDGVTGLLVPSENPDEWYTAIRRLIEDPHLLDSIRRNALAHVLARRTFRTRSADWLKAYSSLEPAVSVKISALLFVGDNAYRDRETLLSLYSNAPAADLEIIIADEGCDEETRSWMEIFARTRKDSVYVRLTEKGAWKESLARASAPYVYFVNVPMTFTSDLFNPMIRILDADPSVAAVAPRIPDQQGGEVPAVISADIPENAAEASGLSLKPLAALPGGTDDQPCEIPAAALAGTLVRKKALLSADDLPDNIGNIVSDAHVCIILRKDGKKILRIPENGPILTNECAYPGESLNSGLPSDKLSVLKIPEKGLKNYTVPGMGSSVKRLPGRSVVVVTYRSAATVGKCLDSVYRTLSINDEIIVVDNGGDSETLRIVEKFMKGKRRCRLLRNSENLGFAEASNIGIRAALTDHIVLLNPDTLVTHDWLSRMQYHLDADPAAAAVGPVSNFAAGLQNIDNYVKEDIGSIRHVDLITDRFYGWYAHQSRDTKLLTGFCMMIRYDVLGSVGLLDPELFLGNDDLDLCWRLRQSGYTLKVALDVFIYHEGQHSFKKAGRSRTDQLVQQSTEVLYRKLQDHYGPDNIPHPLDLWGIDWFKPAAPRFLEPGTSAESVENVLPAAPENNDKALVSIVMLVWNALDYTRKAVDSILKNTSRPFELIIVDNGSSDGTKKYLKKLSSDDVRIKVITNSRNMGFAKGNNQGARIASGKYIMLLNNDVLVPEGWLERMTGLLEKDDRIGMVGPLTNFISGRQMISAPEYSTDEEFYVYAARLAAQYAGRSSGRRRLAGFALLMRLDLYRELGGLDERFGTGNYEDDDLCLRVRNAGYALMVDESTIIHHYGSRTFSHNKIPYQESLGEKKGLFSEKWPDLDYAEFMEKDISLQEFHDSRVEDASQFLIQGHYDEADTIFESILDLDPLHADAIYGLALSAKMRGDTVRAVTSLQKLISLHPDYADAYNQSGIIAFENEDYQNARFLFISALEKAPEKIDIKRNLAEVLLILGDFEEAVRLFHLLYEEVPDDPRTLIRLTEIYRDGGQPATAAEFLQKLRACDIDQDILDSLEQSL